MAGKVRYSTFETLQDREIGSCDSPVSTDQIARRRCNRCCLCCCCDCYGSDESLDGYISASKLARETWTRRRNGPIEYTEADAAAAQKALTSSLEERSSHVDVIRREEGVGSSSETSPGKNGLKTVSRTRFNRRTVTLERTIEKLAGFRTKTPINLAGSNDRGNNRISSSSTGTDSNDDTLGAKTKINGIRFRNVPDITVESYDDGSSLSEACSTPIIGGVRGGSLSNDDDMDRSLHASLLGNRASSSSLGARSESMASVYSGAGEGRWCGSVAVRGEVEFSLQYDYKQKTFEVRVTQCRDLAPVDVKRNRSDPYVKVYLLPDKSKGGKRKTKVKKHTLNPVFDETLKFHMSLNGLETRTLWLTVWHSDMFGRNDFLGEVRLSLENKIFDDPTPRWYPLQERSEPFDDPITCKGEVIVGLKFVPPDPTQQQERLSDRIGSSEKIGSKLRKSWSKGALHVLVKEARNLQTRAKHGGTCDPFCKSYLLPDKGRSGKQKTGVVRRCTGGSPVWGHTFVYKDVSLQELAERGLELTVWDHDRIASNEFLGGVRFNLGTGKHYGKSVEWMDATGRELSLWQNMLERPNFWVEGAVTLRPNLHNHTRNNST